MKRIHAVIILSIFCCAASAQNKAVSVSSNNTEMQILNELQEIHKIQEDAKLKREEIRKQHSNQVDRDSTKIPPHEYGVMLSIAENTADKPLKDGWNLFGWVTILLALVSIACAIITYRAQKKTEKHTENAPLNAQIGVLKDLPRHFYRNLVCTCALLLKFRDAANSNKNGTRRQYPSEANLYKLSTLPDEFILPIDISDDDVYKIMHEEKLLFKNYNTEIEVAAKHFTIKTLSDESLKNDYDNLLFKPFYLTFRMFALVDRIFYNKKVKEKEKWNNISYTIYAFVKEHLSKMDYMDLKKILENKDHEFDNELSILNKIRSDDAFINAVGYKQNSIERGVKRIIAYEFNGKDKIDFIDRYAKEKDENGKSGKTDTNKPEFDRAEINRDKFIKYFEELYRKEEPKTTKTIDCLMCLTGKQQSLVNIDWDENIKAYYFDFFEKDTWDVEELVFRILKIDTVLEMSKIGMIDCQ